MEKLKRYDLNCNIFDVYNYDGLSMQELLCQFYTKINECVDLSNSTLDLCEWLVNEGLKQEVAIKLTNWLNDGTLENLINVALFNKKANKKEVKFHFIKLNNFGECILVQFDDKNMIIDFGQESDRDTILSYLNNKGVKHIDYIIITHYHGDHIGSLEYILNNINVDNCICYVPYEPNFDRFNMNGEQFKQAKNNVYNLLSNKNITKIIPHESQLFNLGEISLKFNNCNKEYFEDYYNTTSEYDENGETDYNNFSLVTTIYHEDVKIFLPSDINVPAQANIINDIECVDLYKTEHHSVNSRVDRGYINKLNPRISVCCNINQNSIYNSETTQYMIKNLKEYYVTGLNGGVIISSNGNKIHNVTNNTRFEDNIREYSSFSSIVDSYNSETDLLTIIKSMKKNTKLTTHLISGYKSCPEFVSSWDGTIEIYKSTDNKATIKIVDGNPSNVSIYESAWHSSKNVLNWVKTSSHIDTYGNFSQIDNTFNPNTTTLEEIIIKMKPQSLLKCGIFKSDKLCPSFVSNWDGMIEIYKLTDNKATLKIKDSSPESVGVYEGVWHSSTNVVKWYVLQEDKIYSDMESLNKIGINSSDDALTIIKAIQYNKIFSGSVKQSFANNLLSSYGGIATIEKVSNNVCRIILTDSNPELRKTWIGVYHRNTGDRIIWSLLNVTNV